MQAFIQENFVGMAAKQGIAVNVVLVREAAQKHVG
jgi:hypothetical protein